MDSDSEQEILIDTSEDEFSASDTESDDSEGTLEDARDWCFLNPSQKMAAPPNFPFKGDPGVKVDILDEDDPLEYFEQFIDKDIINKIVQETNRYAENYLESAILTPKSRSLKWYDTTDLEMKRFFALLILQGVVNKPVERWYWSTRPIISTPFYGNVMSAQRYSLLMKFLHFENSSEFNPQTHPHPKLRKIYDIHNLLVNNFKTVYVPEQLLSIDESLLAYKGLLGWKQFIPTKRARFGIKLYQLCESQSGYIWNSMFYTGKGTMFRQEYEHFGLATKSVMSLVHDLLNQGYTIAADNFYTSPELAELLIQKRTDIFGTMKKNRKDLPRELKEKKLKKGEIVAYQKGKMCAMKWADKKPLCLLSTIHNADMAVVQTRTEEKKKPQLVLDYNHSMGGVDTADQCLSYYRVSRSQQRKYYKKIFRYLLNQAVWNAFVVYQKKGGCAKHVGFRMKLVERLVEVSGECKIAPKPPVRHSENVFRLQERHFPSFVTSAVSKKAYPVRKCVVCHSKCMDNGKRVRRESRYECTECNVGLCVVPCFEMYHTRETF